MIQFIEVDQVGDEAMAEMCRLVGDAWKMSMQKNPFEDASPDANALSGERCWLKCFDIWHEKHLAPNGKSGETAENKNASRYVRFVRW